MYTSRTLSILSFIIAIGFGCGRRREIPPYVLNETKVLQPGERLETEVPPEVRIITPSDQARFTPNQQIQCEIDLIVPEGGRIPTVVQVYVRKGNVSLGGPWHAIERKGARIGNHLKLDATFEAPGRSGRFTMQAVALDSGLRKIPNEAGAGDSKSES